MHFSAERRIEVLGREKEYLHLLTNSRYGSTILKDPWQMVAIEVRIPVAPSSKRHGIYDSSGSLVRIAYVDPSSHMLPDPDPWYEIPRSIFGIHQHVWPSPGMAGALQSVGRHGGPLYVLMKARGTWLGNGGHDRSVLCVALLIHLFSASDLWSCVCKDASAQWLRSHKCEWLNIEIGTLVSFW